MPSGKSISFCAPASFWYLRGYRIVEMAALADYVVYMTYDLHGQWDYANKYAIDGCPAGDCLRSHANLTETLLALSMITKAGVPSNKLAVGVTSYGRSFQMTTPGCTGPTCTYTGGVSGAYPGPCTGTAGYISNAEINAILGGTGTWRTQSGALQSISSYSSYFDNGSQSNVAVYDSTQWVAYMDDAVKADRKVLYQGLDFAGIVDWAIDLQGFGGDNIGSGASSNIVYPPPSLWTSLNPLAGCKPPCIVVFPPYPLSATHTVSWPALTNHSPIFWSRRRLRGNNDNPGPGLHHNRRQSSTLDITIYRHGKLQNQSCPEYHRIIFRVHSPSELRYLPRHYSNTSDVFSHGYTIGHHPPCHISHNTCSRNHSTSANLLGGLS